MQYYCLLNTFVPELPMRDHISCITCDIITLNCQDKFLVQKLSTVCLPHMPELSELLNLELKAPWEAQQASPNSPAQPSPDSLLEGAEGILKESKKLRTYQL